MICNSLYFTRGIFDIYLEAKTINSLVQVCISLLTHSNTYTNHHPSRPKWTVSTCINLSALTYIKETVKNTTSTCAWPNSMHHLVRVGHYSPTSNIWTSWDHENFLDNLRLRKPRLWKIKRIHKNLIIHDNVERAIIMCWSCRRISQQKKLVTRRCVSFVGRFIANFCCSLWTSCRQTGS